ncbi:MAG: T9SS type A sorting domain-containing protein, partial [Chryseobacterium sp.]|nr:T9SS type A sorting domain-containing protein [Chryseobacterium sp.]
FTTALQTWTATFTGKPHNGVVDVAVTKLGAGKNLVGNPYPSNINLDQLTIDNAATANGVYYFWTNINDWVVNNAPTPNGESGNYEDNNYALYNATGGVPSAGSSKKPSGIVKPGQGFLYEARAAGNLRFTNNIRTNEETDKWGTGSVFISNKTAGAKTSPSAERYWLKLTNPAGQFNTLLMAYIEGATNSFEPRFDAKFPVESSDQFYSLSDGTNLIIQGRGYPFTSGDVVPLGMKGFEAGTYTMSLEDREGIFANGQNIYLKDKQTGIITNLSQGSYAFAASAGVSNGRFEIIYEPQTVLAADSSVKETIQVYRDGSDFVIKSPGKKITAIEVYDTSGKLIAKSGANQTEVRMDGSNWVNGVYVIKINRNGELITRKIVR